MFAYLVRRLLQGALTLFLVTFLIYGLIRAMPGSPITADQSLMLEDGGMTQEDRDRFRAKWGLDQDWYRAYFTKFLGPVSRGDFGKTIRSEPVSEKIGERVYPTLLLSVISLSLAYVLAVPLGLYSSARSGRADERGLSVLLYMLYSLPGFVAALFLQLVVAVKLDWLPLEGLSQYDPSEVSSSVYAADVLKHAVLPVIVYTYGSLAYYARFIRANMQETLRQDYVRTARAKGLGEAAVVGKHAFRNTLVPLVTLIGLTLPGLLSGSVIIEQIFNWPGMGRLFFDSILQRDYNVLMGLTLLFSALTLAGQLLADVLYAVVDPRVRLG